MFPTCERRRIVRLNFQPTASHIPPPAQCLFLSPFPNSWHLMHGTAVINRDPQVLPQPTVGFEPFLLCWFQLRNGTCCRVLSFGKGSAGLAKGAWFLKEQKRLWQLFCKQRYGLASTEGFRSKCSCLFLSLSEARLARKDVFKIYTRGCSSLAGNQATIFLRAGSQPAEVAPC